MGTGFEFAEAIDKAGFNDAVESGSFFGAEAGIFLVFLWAGKVDFFVGDIEVPAEGNRLRFFQGADVFEEGFVPEFSVVDASEFVLGVGGIDGDDEEVIEFESEDTALRIVFWDADASSVGEGFYFRQDEGARVTFFFCGIPEGLIFGKEGIEIDVCGECFDFLEAEEVWFLSIDEFGEILFENRAEAVDVPRDEFHFWLFIRGWWRIREGKFLLERKKS